MQQNNEQKVWVTISETVNLGNYENTKIDIGFSKTYTKKEEPTKLIEEGVDKLRKLLKIETKRIRKKLKT